MSSLPARVAAALVSLSTLAAISVTARPAGADECLEAIPAAGARRIFDALADARPGDGCTLENVVTDRSRMKIEWKKDARLQEAILVMPVSCTSGDGAPGGIAAVVPASVAGACPEAAALTKRTVEAGTLGGLVKVSAPGSISASTGQVRASGRMAPRRRLALEAGGITAVLALAGGVRALRRRRRAAGT